MQQRDLDLAECEVEAGMPLEILTHPKHSFLYAYADNQQKKATEPEITGKSVSGLLFLPMRSQRMP